MKNITDLYNKKSIRVLGLMSGTSLDGLDIADISFESNSFLPKIKFNRYFFVAYKKDLQKKILQAIRKKNIKNLAQLHYELGHFFADCVLEYIAKNSLKNHIDLIASHGQTIYHKGGVCSLQIGEADIITQKTKIPVVFDFRAMDIAQDKQGAPLVPYFDKYLQAQTTNKILFLNLGGIANFSIMSEQEQIFSDTGPCNILLNLLVFWKTDGKMLYDKNANFAKEGKQNNKLLQELLLHPYFHNIFHNKKIRKSTGYEEFGENFLQTIVEKYHYLNWKDILKTLTLLSAKTIAMACKKYLPKKSFVVVNGGGMHNPLLMKYLKTEFAPFEIKSFTDVFGFNADAKEAAAFAYFGYQKFQNNSPIPSLGKIAFTT